MVVAVAVLGLFGGLVVHDSDRTLFGLGSKKTPPTLADGSPVPTLPNGSPVPTFRDHTPVPTTPEGRPIPTFADDPRNLVNKDGSRRPTTTRFVESKEDDPEAEWGPVADCPNAEATRPAVLVAQFTHTDNTPLSFDRAVGMLDEANVSSERLRRLGEAHFLGFIANPGTVGSLIEGARRLAALAPKSGEKKVDVEMHCEGHTRSDGSITLVLPEGIDPDAVVYRNGFRDTVDRTFSLSDERGATLWSLKTDKDHTVRRAIAYMRDRDVLAAYPGAGCAVKNGDPNQPVPCGLRVG